MILLFIKCLKMTFDNIYNIVLLSIVFTAVISVGYCNRCEPIQIQLCQTGIPYNTTVYPNLPGHIFQGGAKFAVEQFRPLIENKVQCSNTLREFVCRVFVPECGSDRKPVRPSWEMCTDVAKECEKELMDTVGIPWPYTLNCSKFEDSTLEQLKSMAKSGSQFWFGDDLNSLCNTTRPTLACLLNPRPNKSESIVSRLDNKVNVSSIDRLMEIHYTYKNGSFKSCNNNYTRLEGSFEVDPMSTHVHFPWEVKEMPKVTWKTSPSDLYTLVVYDVGFLHLHALYMNIQGTNINGSTVVKNYTAPLNPTIVANPYVFLLYKQKHKIEGTATQAVANETFQTLKSNGVLISMSWVNIQEDPYSINRFQENNGKDGGNNCPLLVSQALQLQHRPFLPSDQNLNMSMEIVFTSSEETFTVCCIKYNYKEKAITINPIDNSTVKTVYMRAAANPTLTLLKKGVYPNVSKFLDNELYTLIMVDADADNTSGNATHPYLHWLVFNIQNGSVPKGNNIMKYQGPDQNPPTGRHTYYFLLYLQRNQIEMSSVNDYGKRCVVPGIRCFFDIGRFTSDKNLTLTTASWFSVEKDEYIRHINIVDRGNLEEDECKGQANFTTSCHRNLQSIIVG